ncbi:hypothetical protein G6F23_014835 [Rhizopus arrhizus]|nr:hypothetical protein G6F23_014835 [Rhizopus arrhizus]
MDMPAPTTSDEVRSFLGLVGYYRRFIANFADTAHPLTSLIKKGVVFYWNQDCKAAFDSLKNSLVTPPLLDYPDRDQVQILTTDASGKELYEVQR